MINQRNERKLSYTDSSSFHFWKFFGPSPSSCWRACGCRCCCFPPARKLVAGNYCPESLQGYAFEILAAREGGSMYGAVGSASNGPGWGSTVIFGVGIHSQWTANRYTIQFVQCVIFARREWIDFIKARCTMANLQVFTPVSESCNSP